MSNEPSDIANQALDSAAVDFTIGDLTEGSKAAQVCLRWYSQCRDQLLRAANWDFSRAQEPMQLLADATGQTPNVPMAVPRPWLLEYAYPIDCLKARFVPRQTQHPGSPQGNISIPQQIPLMTGLGNPVSNFARLVPTRFLVGNDPNYVPTGTPQNSPISGISATGRTVILSNERHAILVYTRRMIYPSVWDAQFREAMVAYLASEIALPLARDKKFGMQMRELNIKIAVDKLRAARISDGNEGFYSSDIRVDWMDIRNSGGGRHWGGGGFGDGPGVLGYGYDTCSIGGTAY